MKAPSVLKPPLEKEPRSSSGCRSEHEGESPAAAGERFRVLFVDDDPLILQGLQRMLRPLRNEWEMSFVQSGPKALEVMAERPFHVVISDMRMPAMNGAQLLTEIKNRHPATIRLILSGHADKELILQCVGTAHQFLTKPSSPETIRAAISRAVRFNSSVKSERIKQLVVQMDKIPSIPAVYEEIVNKLRKDDTSVEEVSDLISRDLAITAKLMKLVNSAFFGLHREISTPSDATAYLGFETIKALVLGVNAFTIFEGEKLSALSLEALWSHSLAVGSLARRIMQRENAPRIAADEAFLAGLLHDLGKLVLAANLPGEYEAVVQAAKAERISLHQAENAAFGADHADIGGFILSLWGFPSPVVEAITCHHEPGESGVRSLSPVVAVHAANHLARLHPAPSSEAVASPLDTEFLNTLGLGDRLPLWTSLAYDN